MINIYINLVEIIKSFIKKAESLESDSIKKKLFILTIIILFFSMYAVNKLTPLIADDYTFSAYTRNIKNIPDLIYALISFYKYSNGRVFGMLYIYISLMLGKGIFNIINSFAYIIMTLLVYLICNDFKKMKLSLYIIINLLIWFIVKDYGQVMFWISGACNYLWISIPILSVILLFRLNSVKPGCVKDKVINIFLISILSFVAGWGGENSSFGMIMINFLYLIYYKHRKIKIPTWAIASIIMSISGYVIMFIAPGNFIRLNQSDTYPMLFKIIMVTHFIVNFLSIAFIILSAVYLIAKNYFQDKFTNLNIFIQCSIFIITTFCSIYCLSFAPYPTRRAWFCPFLFIIIAIGICYSMFDFSNKKLILCKKIIFSLIVILSINYSVTYIDTLIVTYKLSAFSKERDKYIIEEKGKGNMDIQVKAMTYSYPFPEEHNAFYGLTDVSSDPEYFVNHGLAQYYEVNSITGY